MHIQGAFAVDAGSNFLSSLAFPLRVSDILQELEKYTASKRSLQVWRMQPWFHPPSLLQGHETIARLLAELLSIGSPNGLKPGVADVVLKIDSQMSNGTKPPVAVIRHPRVSHSTAIYYTGLAELTERSAKLETAD